LWIVLQKAAGKPNMAGSECPYQVHTVMEDSRSTRGLSAVATVSQQDDGTLVLTGSGRSEAGPFAFVVTQLTK
jgi:hypothetical protein